MAIYWYKLFIFKYISKVDKFFWKRIPMKCANLERSRCRAQIWLWWMFNFALRVPEPTLVFCCPAHGCKQSSMHGAVVTVLSLRCTARESNPSTLALQGH